MRRATVLSVFMGICLAGSAGCSQMTVTSPGGRVSMGVSVSGKGRLTHTVVFGGRVVVEPSPLGITIDGKDLGDGVVLGEPKRSEINETYGWRGAHPTAVNHCRVMRVPVTHRATKQAYTLEVRAFDSGVAYRYVVPGQGKRTVSGEAGQWRLPSGAEVWYHTNTKNYEGIHLHRSAESFKAGKAIAPPMVAELPGGGYLAVSEAALVNYSGMTLRSLGDRRFRAVFEDDESWTLEGAISTPWRVTMLGDDLNAMVNADIIHNLCQPAPEDLTNAMWIRPGRAVWSWWSQGTGNWTLQKRYADMGAQLGFEYILIDEGWEKWRKGSQGKWVILKDVVDHARAKKVDVWVWKRWNQIADASVRNDFFAKVRECGCVGVKVDFMDSESKERIAFYTSCLDDAARHQLMINYHGANKPTGEPRTWPHEMTREGVRGLEYNKWMKISAHHNATIPFTRFLVGYGDYTPCTFELKRMKGTSWAHQLATAIVFLSPVTHWADNPKNYLANPALDVIKTIPPVWDETVVLGCSQIGEVAAFARRTGKVWFLGILNGGEARTLEIEPAFLGEGTFRAVMLSDAYDRPDAYARAGTTVGKGDTLTVRMRQDGGYVARFTPE